MAAASVDQRFTRYPIVLPLLYTARTPAQNGAEGGWTHNLSEGGACLLLPERLPPRLRLHLHLQTDGAPLEAEGRVIWSGKIGSDLVRHGVAITRIHADHRLLLQDLLLSKGRIRPAGVRLSVALPIMCRCKGQARPPIHGLTGDIGRGGLSLALPDALPPATELVATLRTPAGPLTLPGTVIWVEASKLRGSRTSIRHGLQFTVLDAAVVLALARLLTVIPLQSQLPQPAEAGLLLP